MGLPQILKHQQFIKCTTDFQTSFPWLPKKMAKDFHNCLSPIKSESPYLDGTWCESPRPASPPPTWCHALCCTLLRIPHTSPLGALSICSSVLGSCWPSSFCLNRTPSLFCKIMGSTPWSPCLNCSLLPGYLSALGSGGHHGGPTEGISRTCDYSKFSDTLTWFFMPMSLVQLLNHKSLEGPCPIHPYFPESTKKIYH